MDSGILTITLPYDLTTVSIITGYKCLCCITVNINWLVSQSAGWVVETVLVSLSLSLMLQHQVCVIPKDIPKHHGCIKSE